MSRVDGILERLHGLYPRLIDLSLDRLQVLLGRLGHPEQRLPPVVHVAGTNGKGSTCAFMRAMAEQAGKRVHVYTSPHLVRFNERFRLAGEIVSDEVLATALERVEAANHGEPLTVFEATTAAGFVLFAEHPADLCILEVGLGGRFDATNVIPAPAAAAIASISLDHCDFLGTDLGRIAWEKAGIIKTGTVAVTGAQPDVARDALQAQADAQGVPLHLRGRDWWVDPTNNGFTYRDASCEMHLPAPSLPGVHQYDNAGIAITALRALGLVTQAQAFQGVAHAQWPARMQRLEGALAQSLPADWELWLDGGHNPGAGVMLAQHLAGWKDRPVHVIVGMKQSKDAAAFLKPLIPHAQTLWAVAEPDQHLALAVEDIVAVSGGLARPGPRVIDALRALPRGKPSRVLICGSLYLAGEVLKRDSR